ncbi:MAG: hypothetical protein AAB425_12565 [Bdellovibrionota bacterium]
MNRNRRIQSLTTVMRKGARPCQEDHLMAIDGRGLFSVADGFGGPSPGAEAAKQACDSVREYLLHEAGDRDATMPFVLRSYFSLAGNVLFNALIHANRKLMQLNQNRNVHEKGGASVVTGFLDGDLFAIANLGACSASLLRGGARTELVIPRTLGRMVHLGADGDSHSGISGGLPMTALGLVDDLEPEIFEYRVKDSDWLLLHTDGIQSLELAELQTIQKQGMPVKDATDLAFEALHQAKDDSDNAAAILIMF